eukprot:319689-Amphidinium_carterae.1
MGTSFCMTYCSVRGGKLGTVAPNNYACSPIFTQPCKKRQGVRHMDGFWLWSNGMNNSQSTVSIC